MTYSYVLPLPGQSLAFTHLPLSSSRPGGQKQPCTQILMHGLRLGSSQVRGQAVPQFLKTMPLEQVGVVGRVGRVGRVTVVLTGVGKVVLVTRKQRKVVSYD